MFQTSDDKLIKKALKGQQGAWLSLVARYERDVYHYCLRMIGHPEDAKDLMQEVFIGVCRNLATFRGDSSFKTWVIRIAHFRIVEYFRKKRDHLDVDSVPEEADDTACHEAWLSQSQTNQQLVNTLSHLGFEQKIVVELKYFQGLTFDQIGTQLGISTNTVKSRLYAALAKLKVLLQEQQHESESA